MDIMYHNLSHFGTWLCYKCIVIPVYIEMIYCISLHLCHLALQCHQVQRVQVNDMFGTYHMSLQSSSCSSFGFLFSLACCSSAVTFRGTRKTLPSLDCCNEKWWGSYGLPCSSRKDWKISRYSILNFSFISRVCLSIICLSAINLSFESLSICISSSKFTITSIFSLPTILSCHFILAPPPNVSNEL